MPQVFVIRMADEPTRHETAMTTAIDPESLRVHYVSEFLESQLCKLAVVVHIKVAYLSSQRIQIVFAVADTSAIVGDQQAISLHQQEVSNDEKHIVGGCR